MCLFERKRHTIPQQHCDIWLSRLRRHLADERVSQDTIESHVCVARVFLRYLASRNLRVESVRSTDLVAYMRWQRQAYRRRHGHRPYDDKHWRSYYTAPIHHLLRMVQGTWPPVPEFDRHLRALREALQRRGLAGATIWKDLKEARRFLRHLTASGVRAEEATPNDVESFLNSACRVYRRTNLAAHDPYRWRGRYRRTIRRLLECVRGEWPPPSAGKTLLRAFKAHLVGRGIRNLDVFNRHARLFIEYLTERNIDVAKVQPAEVAEYFRKALALSRRQHPNLVENPRLWLRVGRRAVNAILRFVQGEWPPGSKPSPLVGQFRAHLQKNRYSPGGIAFGVAAVNQFLRYLQGIVKPVESARPADVAAFVEHKRQQYRERNGRPPANDRKWRSGYSGPIHRMLRMMDPQWPRPEPPRTASEALQRELLEGYRRWVVEERGLSKETCAADSDRVKRFLCWLNLSDRARLMDLTVTEIDAYLTWRLPPLRRAGRHHVCQALRSFLRYLYSEHLIARDLSAAVTGPKRYDFEDIPRALPAQHVQAVIEHTRRDHSPIGRRDYAMLLLLATYGMRAKEVTELRLDDIDWRQDRLRIHHSKTGYETIVPLVAPVGEALLNYLKHGRPPTTLRQVFLQAIAPYQPFSRAGSLCTIIRYRLQKAGIDAAGHQGAHAFRHARAHSLLRASVPIKAIGDLLGHRSPDSTNVYLKLATEDLRAVSLEIPKREASCRSGLTKKKRS